MAVDVSWRRAVSRVKAGKEPPGSYATSRGMPGPDKPNNGSDAGESGGGWVRHPRRGGPPGGSGDRASIPPGRQAVPDVQLRPSQRLAEDESAQDEAASFKSRYRRRSRRGGKQTGRGNRSTKMNIRLER